MVVAKTVIPIVSLVVELVKISVKVVFPRKDSLKASVFRNVYSTTQIASHVWKTGLPATRIYK